MSEHLPTNENSNENYQRERLGLPDAHTDIVQYIADKNGLEIHKDGITDLETSLLTSKTELSDDTKRVADRLAYIHAGEKEVAIHSTDKYLHTLPTADDKKNATLAALTNGNQEKSWALPPVAILGEGGVSVKTIVESFMVKTNGGRLEVVEIASTYKTDEAGNANEMHDFVGARRAATPEEERAHRDHVAMEMGHAAIAL